MEVWHLIWIKVWKLLWIKSLNHDIKSQNHRINLTSWMGSRIMDVKFTVKSIVMLSIINKQELFTDVSINILHCPTSRSDCHRGLNGSVLGGVRCLWSITRTPLFKKLGSLDVWALVLITARADESRNKWTATADRTHSSPGLRGGGEGDGRQKGKVNRNTPVEIKMRIFYRN